MSTLTQVQYTVGQDVAINMHGLADGSKAVSDAIDNSTTRYQQADIQIKFKTNQHKIAKGNVVIGILRSVDGGTTYDSHLRPGNILAVVDDLDKDTTYTVSVSTNQLGWLPSHFKISVRNGTGAPFFFKEDKFSCSFAGKRTLDSTSELSMAMSMSPDWIKD